MKRTGVVLCLAVVLGLAMASCGGSSSKKKKKKGPAAPTGVAAAPGDAENTISWNPVTGATSYNVYYDVTPGVDTSSLLLAGVSSPHVHTGLTNGTTYYYRVTALNTKGESKLSAEVSATPMAGLLSPPTNVVATAGDAIVTITFTPTPGATTHNIYWSTSPGVTTGDIRIAGVTSPYVHSGLLNGTTYYYRMTAQDLSGESALSVEVSATPAAGLPVPPTNIVVTPGDTINAITFTPTPGATAHHIYFDTTPGVTTGDPKITGISSPYIHTGLTNGTTYYYRLTAENGAGESALSVEVSGMPSANPPNPPTNVTAVAGDGMVTITFTPSPGATMHHIYFDTTPGVTLMDTQIPMVSSPYIHSGLVNGTTYYYAMTAENANGESGLSAEVSATPSGPSCGVASVTAGGTPLTFSNVTHSYSAGEISIIMLGSTPVNWEIQLLYTAPDSNPGTIGTCTHMPNLLVNVFDDLGNWYVETACISDVTVAFSTYETTPGNCTSGTFDGIVEDIGSGSAMPLTGGVFDALRQ